MESLSWLVLALRLQDWGLEGDSCSLRIPGRDHIIYVDYTCYCACRDDSPRYTSSLQHVGYAHVPGPDVKLPLLQTQYPTQYGARVDPDPHVHVKVQLLLHVPAVGGLKWPRVSFPSLLTNIVQLSCVVSQGKNDQNPRTDRMVLIIARPISTQCRAWACCGSGTPDTQ